MTGRHVYVSAAVLGLSLSLVMASGTTATGVELSPYQGAWLQSGSSCSDVYLTSGKDVSFRKPTDIFAPAFIISGTRLRTPLASCRIKSIKPSGSRQVLALGCANSVSVGDVSVLIASAPDGTLKRYFNAQDTMGSTYERCSR
jgi:hypothetical protein